MISREAESCVHEVTSKHEGKEFSSTKREWYLIARKFCGTLS